MNICIYTSEQPSAANLLNISHLIDKRPQHNYSFLTVRIPKKAKSWKDSIKKAIVQRRFNDGRFDYQKDLLELAARTAAYILPYSPNAFHNVYVDAVNDSKSIQHLQDYQPDIILQAGAGILKPAIFESAGIATINVHHGVAPEVRGIDSTVWCMLYGCYELIGATCHLIDAQLDTGCIIKQASPATVIGNFIEVQLQNFLTGRELLLESIDLLETSRTLTHKSLASVRSYYFGNVDPFLYYALKKRNFEPLFKLKQRSFKIKDKKVLC